jgi:dihydroorotate dehydrogenase (NAD+) catalytic subunit
MRIDIVTRRPALGNATGGLSGRAILPVNLALVWKIAEGVGIPVVGSGGVASAEDALEYLMAGARAVQVGTALFLDPEVPGLIARGLLEHMRRDGVGRVSEYVGLARGTSWRQAVATA